MARHIDWQNRLTALIDAKRLEPFDFATHNCLLWAASGIEAVLGQSPHKPGYYKDEKSALRWLKSEANSVPDFLSKALGQEKQPIAFARHGDIVLADTDKNSDLEVNCGTKFGLVPGVCYGTISFFVGESGLVAYETLRLDSALWVS